MNQNKMKKKNEENYLERVPIRKTGLEWTVEEESKVTLNIENKGVFNRIAQKFLKKPPVTYVHLDEFGSFIWQIVDGKKNIIVLGELVKEKFGEDAEPLYERLAKFFQILDSYGFVQWKERTDANFQKPGI